MLTWQAFCDLYAGRWAGAETGLLGILQLPDMDRPVRTYALIARAAARPPGRASG